MCPRNEFLISSKYGWNEGNRIKTITSYTKIIHVVHYSCNNLELCFFAFYDYYVTRIWQGIAHASLLKPLSFCTRQPRCQQQTIAIPRLLFFIKTDELNIISYAPKFVLNKRFKKLTICKVLPVGSPMGSLTRIYPFQTKLIIHDLYLLFSIKLPCGTQGNVASLII